MKCPRLGWIALAVLLVGCGASVIPTIRSEQDRIDGARQLMAQRQWTLASELLKTYVANNAGSAQVDAAIYLLGECYLGLEDWASASIEFERLLRDYPESDSSGSASLRLGESYFGQARPPDFDQEYTHKAIDQWRGYLRDFPGHWRNAEGERRLTSARQRLATKDLRTAKLYLKLKLDDPARVYFGRIDRDYSDLDVVGDAWLGLAALDARHGNKADAIEYLRRVEERFAGRPIAARASNERARLER